MGLAMRKGLIKLGTICSAVGLTMGLLLTGCGGGGGGAALPSTNVIVQDGNIVGALVQDAGLATAAHKGAGVYSFAPGHVVTLPITIRSRNTPATVSACMDAASANTVCDPVNILTYQDLDASGTWTAGDVMYNGSMDVSCVPNTAAGTTIYANPISTLVPASCVAPAVAGLTALDVQGAGTANFTAAPASAQIVAAQLLAVQEALINAGADPAAVASLLNSVGANAVGGGATLASELQAALTLPGGTAANLLFLGAPFPKQADLIAAVGNIATTAAAAMTGAPTATNYEAIISVIQTAIPVNATLAAARINELATPVPPAAPYNLIASSAYSIASGTVQTAINNQTLGLAAVVNPLFIMPVYDIYSKATGHFQAGVPPTYVTDNITPLDTLTGFSMTYNAAAKTITINGANGIGAPAIAGKVLTFDPIQQAYGFADTLAAPGAKLFVSVNLNFMGTKVLGVCTDYVSAVATPVCTMNYFALPTQAQVCGFTFADTTPFAARTVPTAGPGHSDYAGRFATMNGQTSVCP